MTYETVLYECIDGVATITLNRPDRLNAVNETLARELGKAFDEAAGDPAARCVILTGAGRGFCAGMDIGAMRQEGVFAAGDILRSWYHPVILKMAGIEKPVVAAVNGAAAGAGASLAFACDFRIASDKASFLQAFVRLGLVPDSGATYFLPRLVGYARALEMMALGEPVDAEGALRAGLVTRVVAHDDLEAEAHSFAERLAHGPTMALALTRKGLTFGSNADLESAIDYEADLQTLAAMTSDFAEGVAAFREKRKAKFEGR